MTLEEWYSSDDIRRMIAFAKSSNRKQYLFAVACCKRILHLMIDERSRKAVEVAELFADGKCSEQERAAAAAAAVAAAAANAANAALAANAAAYAAATAHAAANAAYAAANAAYTAAYVANAAYAANTAYAAEAARKAAVRANVDFLREIVNPFYKGRTTFNQEIKAIAQECYDSQDYSSWPIIADYLDEFYDAQELSDHLRNDSHCKGCWALDVILGN